MPSVPITFSRWGKSSYETQEDVDTESRLLSSTVDVLPSNADADVILVHSKQKVDASFLSQVPSVKLVITSTSGYEHLDLEYLRRKNIRAARMPLLRRDAVVESTLGMILEATRKVGHFRKAASEGKWVRSDLPNINPILLRGLNIGILGAGVIGRRMMEVLHFLGANLYGADPRGVPEYCKEATLDEMIEGCAVLSLHCDHNINTHNIISKDRLSTAKGLILVNTARGKLIDFDYAVGALERGELGYLGLDVFEEEPFEKINYAHPMLCFTPHAAGYHPNLAMEMRDNLLKYLRQYNKGKRLLFEL
ncbi:MAG: NAD(P)-dependent oxidoreductase [Myxococcota bacterium]|nr:NAD(P)-dependent oxidoreductase [Myxococcota bacterium]